MARAGVCARVVLDLGPLKGRDCDDIHGGYMSMSRAETARLTMVAGKLG